MAGSSLWLVPPPSHPLHAALTKLIEATLPAQFPHEAPRPPVFAPHLTLTSMIDPSLYGSDPQGWLDGIRFPRGSDVQVLFERVKTEDVYYRRCYVKCSFEGLRDVAGIARARGVLGEYEVGDETEKWLAEWKGSFGPHVSLMYGDTPIDEDTLKEVEEAVEEAGIALAEPNSPSGPHTMGGWEGGVVWLVPTDQDISEWKPIATRRLKLEDWN